MILQDSSNTYIFGINPVVFSGLISALVASSITILITHLQNKAHAKRQKELLDEQAKQQTERLEHESNQKRLEREMTMRRDIYLSGAESLGKMQQFLLSFADAKQTPESRNMLLNGVSESLTKVTVIANLEIIEKLSEVQTHYTESITLLLEKRMEFDNALENRIHIDNYIEDLRQKGLQQLSIYDSVKNSDNQAQKNAILEKFQEIDIEKRKQENELETLKLQIVNQQIELLQMGFQAFNKFQFLAGQLNLLARRELNFPIDEQKYIELINKTNEQAGYFVKWFENVVEKHKHEL